MKLKPLGDRLIVRAIEEEETTASGIVLPDTAKEKPQKGKVLAVGDGKHRRRRQAHAARRQEGDEVLYSKYGGTEIKIDGEDLLVLRESDVLAEVLRRPTGPASTARPRPTQRHPNFKRGTSRLAEEK